MDQFIIILMDKGLLSLSKFSIKNLVKEKKTWSRSCVVTIKVFLMIGQRKGGNSMYTKSKMAPVNISQNDYLALSLCITILRRRIRHRTRVGKRRTRYWFSYLYNNILLILYSILLIWPQPFQSILLSCHVSTLF